MTDTHQDAGPWRGGVRYYEIEFAEDGTQVRDSGLAAAVAAGQIDDVFVFSHGWNTGRDSARLLYTEMFGILGDMLGARDRDRAARTAVTGVFWPALLFPDDDPMTAAHDVAAVAASGQLLAEALVPAFPQQKDVVMDLGRMLDQRGHADRLNEFHRLARRLVATPSLDAGEDSGEAAALDLPSGVVIGYHAGWPAADVREPSHRASTGPRSPVEALWDGAREVLRTLSYYEMKNRAGVVGRSGLGPLVSRLTGPGGRRPRVHLLGHSFGARLVAYALSGLAPEHVGRASPVKSLTLIQGAFSHFAFAAALPFDSRRAGALAGFRDRVDGPLVSTFSGRDRAVGWWYPMASMLRRQDANSQQELLHRWGAMGATGFQVHDSVTLRLAEEGHRYDFTAGTCYRLNSSAVVRRILSRFAGAHSDVCHPEVVWACLSAAGLSTARP